jgi:proteasome lid subunit RPN8/RPN11
VSSLDVRSIDEKALRKQSSPTVKHEFRVLLSEAAFDRAVARGDGDVTREIGGVLVGELLRDDAGPYLWIDATIDALHAEEKGAELTFTHATWEYIHKEMDGKHQDKKVVGWYHTHPGFGVFLSDRDQFIHKSFFNLPFQVAFVYDPKTHEHGMFTWHDNEVWRARRYWIGSREQVWDGPRVAVDKQAREPQAEKRKPEAERDDGGGQRLPDSSPQDGTPGMFVVIGVVLLLLGGVVGHWLGSRSTGQVVEQAQREIELAKQDGAARALTSLQSDLVALLRDTFNDEALRRPVSQAIGILDQMIAALPPEATAQGAAAAGGPGAVAPGSGPGAAAAGPVAPDAITPGAAGSGAVPATAAPAIVPGATAPAPVGSGATRAGSGNIDPRWMTLASQLKTARATLVQLQLSRDSLQRDLARLASVARGGSELSREIAHDLTEQRSGLGQAYAELASDAAKAGDKNRARRLLTAAAHLDPGNRARYEKQLQSFDSSGRLSPDTPDSTGSAGQGEPR